MKLQLQIDSENLAVQRFFSDIKKDYDNKLGYGSTLERIKFEIEKTNKELSTLQMAHCKVEMKSIL
jgi:hypothetical protein